jgi:hypothetical protein
MAAQVQHRAVSTLGGRFHVSRLVCARMLYFTDTTNQLSDFELIRYHAKKSASLVQFYVRIENELPSSVDLLRVPTYCESYIANSPRCFLLS